MIKLVAVSPVLEVFWVLLVRVFGVKLNPSRLIVGERAIREGGLMAETNRSTPEKNRGPLSGPHRLFLHSPPTGSLRRKEGARQRAEVKDFGPPHFFNDGTASAKPYDVAGSPFRPSGGGRGEGGASSASREEGIAPRPIPEFQPFAYGSLPNDGNSFSVGEWKGSDRKTRTRVIGACRRGPASRSIKFLIVNVVPTPANHFPSSDRYNDFAVGSVGRKAGGRGPIVVGKNCRAPVATAGNVLGRTVGEAEQDLKIVPTRVHRPLADGEEGGRK